MNYMFLNQQLDIVINSLIKKGIITKFTIETSGSELSCLIGIKINTKANIKKLYENFLEKGLNGIYIRNHWRI